MTAQFHEGQEVEIGIYYDDGWRKAKIVRQEAVTYCDCAQCNDGYEVEFRNGSRAVIDATHIREQEVSK